MTPTFSVGQKIKFLSEKRPYTIRACSERYVICTKPFNLRKNILYTIIDLEQNIRGTENLVFEFGFETDDECNNALLRLQSGESEITHRNYVQLDIQTIRKPVNKFIKISDAQ